MPTLNNFISFLEFTEISHFYPVDDADVNPPSLYVHDVSSAIIRLIFWRINNLIKPVMSTSRYLHFVFLLTFIFEEVNGASTPVTWTTDPRFVAGTNAPT